MAFSGILQIPFNSVNPACFAHAVASLFFKMEAKCQADTLCVYQIKVAETLLTRINFMPV